MNTMTRDLTPGTRITRPGGGIWTVTYVVAEDNGEYAVGVRDERTGDKDVFWQWGHRPADVVA